MSVDRTEVSLVESVKYLDIHLTPEMIEKGVYFIRDDDGVNNAVYEIDGEKYRVRVETFVKRKMGEETHIFYQEQKKENHYGTHYKIPGGSIEEDRTLAQQAEAECNEEILAKVANVQYTGICYVNKYDPKTIPQWHKDILWPQGLVYVGAITFVFTADYVGPYRKHIDDHDKDDLSDKGNWHSLEEFNKLRATVHSDVVLENLSIVTENMADMTPQDWMLHQATRMLSYLANDIGIQDFVKVEGSFNRDWEDGKLDKVEVGKVDWLADRKDEVLSTKLKDLFSKRFSSLYRGYEIEAVPKGGITKFFIVTPESKIPSDVKLAYEIFEKARTEIPEGKRFYLVINDDFTITRHRAYRDGRQGVAPLQKAYDTALAKANSYGKFIFSYDGEFVKFSPVNAFGSVNSVGEDVVTERMGIVPPTAKSEADRQIIVDSFSEKEKKIWGTSTRDIQEKERKATVFQKILYDDTGTVPTAFVNLTDSGKLGLADGDVNLSIAVHSDYRKKGLAKSLVKDAVRWFKDSDYQTLTWIADDGNEASQKLAKDCGFVHMEHWKDKHQHFYMITNPSMLSVIGESAKLKEISRTFLSDEDIEYRLEDWINDKENILFITGLSGSGKSTLARKLSKEYKAKLIELDVFGDIVKKEHPEVNELIKEERRLKVIDYAISESKAKKTIIEGAQIVYADPNLIKRHSCIILGASFLLSSIRMAKRSLFDIERESRYSGTKNPLLNAIHALTKSIPFNTAWNYNQFNELNKFRVNFEAVSVSKGFCLPVDYSKFKSDDSRVICINTHLLNMISSGTFWVPIITAFDVIGGKSLIGALAANSLLFIPYAAYMALDQLFAVDFGVISHDKNNQIIFTNGILGYNVRAIGDGEVVETDNSVKNKTPEMTKLFKKYGNFIVIKHDNFFSTYCHLQKGSLKVKVGDKVRKGQVIAKVGFSGNSSSDCAHLHLELCYTNIPNNKNKSPLPIYDIPRMLHGFEKHDYAPIANSTALNLWNPFSSNDEFDKVFNNLELRPNTTGEIHWACFLTEPPKNKVPTSESMDVIVFEDYNGINLSEEEFKKGAKSTNAWHVINIARHGEEITEDIVRLHKDEDGKITYTLKDSKKFPEYKSSAAHRMITWANAYSSALKFSLKGDEIVATEKKPVKEAMFPVVEMAFIDNSYEVDLDEESLKKFKPQYKGLSHVRIGEDYQGKLILVKDNGKENVVGFINVRKSDGMIQALEMSDQYRGKGGGTELLKIAERLGANQLTVNVNNDIAHDMYKKNGWSDTKIVGKMQYMVRDGSHLAMELASIDSLGLNETHRLEAILETVQHSDAVYEFYRQYNTPWQLMNGLRKVGARWPSIPNKKSKSVRETRIVWPEQIISGTPAVCLDYALLEHYWAEYHHLENYLMFIGFGVKGSSKWSGHAVGIVRFQGKFYILDYHARHIDKAKKTASKNRYRAIGPEIIGPYGTPEAAAEAYKDDIVLSTQAVIEHKKMNTEPFVVYRLFNKSEVEKIFDPSYGDAEYTQTVMALIRFGYYFREVRDFVMAEKGHTALLRFYHFTDFLYTAYDTVTATFESTEEFTPLGETYITEEDQIAMEMLEHGDPVRVSRVIEEIDKEATEFVPEYKDELQPVQESGTLKNPDVGISSITDLILSVLDSEKRLDIKEFATTKSGKRFMYTRCKVMNKFVPLVIFLSYCEGLTTVMRKANIRFEFSDTRPRLDGYDAVNRGVIPFADGYVIFDKYPLENSLLMNGLAVMDTKSVEYADMDSKDVYVNLFDVLYGARMLANALDNFYEWMIDPVTFTILEDLNYPTDFVGLMLAGNKLMSDNNFVDEISMKNWRIRKNEMVYAESYKRIAEAYTRFRMTSNNRNPVKISIPRDQVIKSIMQSQVVEDVSELSPVIEVKKANTITDQGPSGTNLKEAYTMKRRCYHDTMLGVMAISTSPDANVGIKKDLTVEPNVMNARGYVKEKEDRDMEEPNLFSMVELLTPGSATQDDQVRLAMESKQSSHITPVRGASPVLMSNGAEKVLPYNISSDFVVTAKEDGIVEVFDEKTGVCVVKYKDGKTQLINMNSKVVKNGAGGFYLTNKLIINKLKKGTRFKKNDILAYNDRFFSESDAEGTRFNVGVLTKVACMSTYINFEDGDFVTDQLSKKLGTDVCMEISAIVGMNSNVTFMVKKGDYVNINDPLIIYDASSKDENFNKMLDNIGKDLKEEITGMGRTPIKAKYAGIIEDIKVYSTVESKLLSPSLKKIVEGYWSEIRAQEAKYKKYEGKNMIETFSFMEKAGPVDGGDDGKVMGVKVGEGVYIRFFIRYQDNLDIGDKLVHFTAMKYVNAEMVPKGQEPFSLDHPEEEVSSCFAPAGVMARMTPSIMKTMYGNKVIVELKRKWLELYMKDNPSFKPKDTLY